MCGEASSSCSYLYACVVHTRIPAGGDPRLATEGLRRAYLGEGEQEYLHLPLLPIPNPTDVARTSSNGPMKVKNEPKSKLQDKTRQDKTRQDKTRQDKARQDKAKQDKTRQDKTRQDKTRQDKTR